MEKIRRGKTCNEEKYEKFFLDISVVQLMSEIDVDWVDGNEQEKFLEIKYVKLTFQQLFYEKRDLLLIQEYFCI